jgi:hypothetical protein
MLAPAAMANAPTADRTAANTKKHFGVVHDLDLG